MRRGWAASLAVSGLALGASAQSPPTVTRVEVVLSLPEYVRALQDLSDTLRTGQVEGARRRALYLLTCRVEARGERLAPDATVLGPIADAPPRGPAAGAASEVAALAAALEDGAAGPAVAADQARLDRLRREDEARALERGGLVRPGRPPTLAESAQQALAALGEKVRRALRALIDFLARFSPRRPSARDPSSPFTTSIMTVAMVAVVAAGLALLAFHALRRRKGEEDAASAPAPTASSRDADPLSREADEWESYARELAQSGRWREAVRAVYHAVLMTLFRSGRLHHQKGRTNWEYVSRLPPDAEARPGFMRLTRAFDREWYGRDRSTREAFAECAEEARSVLRLLDSGAPGAAP
jgi:uncharacterized protein DUF4129